MLSEYLLKSYEIYIDTQYSVLELSKRFEKKFHSNIVTFDISLLLKHSIELYANKALDKDVTISLVSESCFPKEVTGDKTIFELIFNFALKYFISHLYRESLKISAGLKQTTNSGFLLSFDFECLSGAELTEKSINLAFQIKGYENSELSEYKQKNAEFYLEGRYFKKLIEFLNGNVEIGSHADKVYISLEIPFDTSDQFKPKSEIIELNLAPKIKLNDYSIKWTKEEPHPIKLISRKSAEFSNRQNSLGEAVANANNGPLSNTRKDALNTPEISQVDEAKAREIVAQKLKLINEARSPQLQSSKRRTIMSSVPLFKKDENGNFTPETFNKNSSNNGNSKNLIEENKKPVEENKESTPPKETIEVHHTEPSRFNPNLGSKESLIPSMNNSDVPEKMNNELEDLRSDPDIPDDKYFFDILLIKKAWKNIVKHQQ